MMDGRTTHGYTIGAAQGWATHVILPFGSSVFTRAVARGIGNRARSGQSDDTVA